MRDKKLKIILKRLFVDCPSLEELAKTDAQRCSGFAADERKRTFGCFTCPFYERDVTKWKDKCI